jgi:hypothetical protein
MTTTISTITNITMKIPVYTPAPKISPMASQLVMIMARDTKIRLFRLFIFFVSGITLKNEAKPAEKKRAQPGSNPSVGPRLKHKPC